MEEELELRLLPEDRVSPELGYGSSRGGMSSSYDIYSTMTNSPRARISPSSDVRVERSVQAPARGVCARLENGTQTRECAFLLLSVCAIDFWGFFKNDGEEKQCGSRRWPSSTKTIVHCVCLFHRFGCLVSRRHVNILLI